jgi:hypothetical protein
MVRVDVICLQRVQYIGYRCAAAIWQQMPSSELRKIQTVVPIQMSAARSY